MYTIGFMSQTTDRNLLSILIWGKKGRATLFKKFSKLPGR